MLLASHIFRNIAPTEELGPTAFRVNAFYKEIQLIATAFYYVDCLFFVG